MENSKKFTKQDWKEGKCALKWEKENKEKINKFFQECNSNNSEARGVGKYYFCRKYHWNGEGYYTHEQTTSLPIVTINELLEEEFVLPEKWCVKITPKNRKILLEWRKECRFSEGIGFLHFPSRIEEVIYEWDRGIIKGYTEISFENFEKHILNKNTMETKKIIVGYKLKAEYEQYRKAALKISNTVANWENLLAVYDISSSQTKYIDRLKEAGVLELWFEAVYEEERYKVIPNTDDKYECSQKGAIRNIETKKELSKSLSSKGYHKVNLWLNGKNVNRVVHRLIAETWIENPNNYETINHKDGDKLNNNVENLEWCTIQMNNLHYKLTNGKFNSSLTEEDILDIYNNYNNYGEQKIAAELYNVTQGTISFIKNDKTFTHITQKCSSPEEIKEAENALLLEEAKKIYVPGVRVNSVYGANNHLLTSQELLSHPIKISEATSNTIVGYGLTLYAGGKWAEIVTTPQIEINGYRAKFSDDSVSFGCQEYTESFVITLNNCLQKNNFKMDYKNEIKEMAEYFLNKK